MRLQYAGTGVSKSCFHPIRLSIRSLQPGYYVIIKDWKEKTSDSGMKRPSTSSSRITPSFLNPSKGNYGLPAHPGNWGNIGDMTWIRFLPMVKILTFVETLHATSLPQRVSHQTVSLLQ